MNLINPGMFKMCQCMSLLSNEHSIEKTMINHSLSDWLTERISLRDCDILRDCDCDIPKTSINVICKTLVLSFNMNNPVFYILY